jgi:hypothetical protein
LAINVNSTANQYYNSINTVFPVAGVNNNSQIFRDNFSNIQNALGNMDLNISGLTAESTLVNQSNEFSYVGSINHANLLAPATGVYDLTGSPSSGVINLSYSNGSYQKISLSDGPTVVNVVDWPASGTAGILFLRATPINPGNCTIAFDSSFNVVGNAAFPDTLSTPGFYQIWSDDGGTNVFVDTLGHVDLTVATATTVTAVQQLQIRNNYYTTGSYNATVVTDGVYYGNLGLVPNRIDTQITGALTAFPGDLYATQFGVTSLSGIVLGAKTYLPSTSTQLIVTHLSGTTVTVSPAFPVGGFSPGYNVSFYNPTFPNQPTLVSLSTQAVTTTTGNGYSNLAGQLYITSGTLWASWDDSGQTEQPWIQISADYLPKFLANGSTAVTQTSTDVSSLVATNEFVHSVMPYGAIIMWYGTIANIPQGWALCDGNNGTPDLRNKFIVGASTDIYNTVSNATQAMTFVTNTSTLYGGSADAIVPDHTHNASSTVTDPGHHHGQSNIVVGTVSNGGDNNGVLHQNGYSNGSPTGVQLIDNSSTGITVNISVNSTGTSVKYANLPPYYSLAYIMKVV